MLIYSTFDLGEFIFSHTHTLEILLRMGMQPRFVGYGKIGWARLTDYVKIFVISIDLIFQILNILTMGPTEGITKEKRKRDGNSSFMYFKKQQKYRDRRKLMKKTSLR